MYNVVIKESDIRKFVHRFVANQNISQGVSLALKRIYHTENQYYELIPELFHSARQGRLEPDHGQIYRRGGKAKLQKNLLIRTGHAFAPATAKRLATKLIEIDQAARSQLMQQQQLTNY